MPSGWDPQVFPDWRWPGGPHLEVSVYRPRLSDQESLVETLHALLGLGAVLKGVGTTDASAGTRTPHRDLKKRRISVSDLGLTLADTAQEIRQFYTDGYFDGTSVVSLDLTSEEASRTDRHPVDVFFCSFDFELGDDVDRARIGEQARRLLLELARSPEVAYGAIVGEGHWVGSPSDMAREHWSGFFGSFLLTDWVDAEDRDVVLATFDGAYVEQLEFGTYISTYQWLNPGRMRLLDGKQRERSDLVRRVLAKNLA